MTLKFIESQSASGKKLELILDLMLLGSQRMVIFLVRNQEIVLSSFEVLQVITLNRYY